MRIALLSPYSLSVPGGVQGQVLALAGALERAGHDALVLGPLDEAARSPRTPLSGQLVVGVGRSVPVPANGSVARLALGPVVQRRTWHAVAAFAPDVLHLHEPLAPGPTWAGLLRPEPKVGTFHRAGAVLGAPLLRAVAGRAAARLTVRTAVSEEARATAAGLAGGEYEIIGNGVDLDRFARAAPWPTEAPTVLFVGRHEERKGLPVLLDAFARLAPELDAHLWVTGDGPAGAVLRQRYASAPRIAWLGRVDDQELASRVAGAHVLCVPSIGGESFGVVLVEGMAGRAVVVASALPGYASVLAGHGLLVPPGDASALAGALTGALGDSAAGRGRASPAALDAAARHAEQWSLDTVTSRYVSAYERARGG